MQNIILKSILNFIGALFLNLFIRTGLIWGLCMLLINVAEFSMPAPTMLQVAILCVIWTIFSLKPAGFKKVLTEVAMKEMQKQGDPTKANVPKNEMRPIIGFGRPTPTDKKL